MLITTKYSIGDVIWFIKESICPLQQSVVVKVSVIAEEKNTLTNYWCWMNLDGHQHLTLVKEKDAFSSKDELINTITERFYENISVNGST